MTERRRIIELSHEITEGMITFPGLPGPEITYHRTREESRSHYEDGTEFAIHRVNMVGNTGTYLDSPFHRYADGADLAELDLYRMADVPITLVDVAGRDSRAIEVEDLRGREVAGTAVLLRTDWDLHWGTERYGREAPYLSGEGADWLVDAGAALVGIDSVNIDDSDGPDRPAHSILLAAEIPVLEHLTGLGALPTVGARLHAAPPRIHGLSTFPTRAYAVVE